MHALAVLFPLAAAVTAALCLRTGEAEPHIAASSTVVTAMANERALPAHGDVLASPAAAGVATLVEPRPAALVTFADGSRRASLNGVATDLTMPWPGGGPFSPIVEVVTHQGQQWFRHADGTASTTVMAKDQVSGREVAVPMCCRPEPVMRERQGRR